MIRTYQPDTRDVRAHVTAVDCTYQVITDSGGARLLALSTFGSDERQEKNKVSQSMQFNEEMAGFLLNSILEAFPGLQVQQEQ